jgi:hypothetical protein
VRRFYNRKPLVALTRFRLVLSRPKVSASAGRLAEAAAACVVRVGEGCGDPTQNDVNGMTPKITTMNPFYYHRNTLTGQRTWNCAAGSSGAAVIAVDLNAYAQTASPLKSIWNEGGGTGDGRKELLEVMGSCKAMKGLSPLTLASLADTCNVVTFQANTLLRVQGHFNCKM